MNDSQPLAWRGSVAHDAVTDLAETTAWFDRDSLVLDLPPGTGDVPLSILQETSVDGLADRVTERLTEAGGTDVPDDPVLTFQPFEVEKQGPETWVLRTVRP